MTFNPDNLIFFYLTGAVLALAFAILAYATLSRRSDKHKKHRR